jgi:hypothetical protein
MSEEIRLQLREDLVARPADWCASKWILKVHPHIFSTAATDEFWNWEKLSPHHFDIPWRTLKSLGTRRYSLTREQQTFITDHVGRLIYWGTAAVMDATSITKIG